MINENELNRLRQEYESIPIPPQLPLRVQASLARSKKELEETPMNNQPNAKRHHYFRNTFATAAAAMLAVVVLANSNAGIAHAMEQIPVLGAITKVVTFRVYEDQNGGADASIQVPHVEGGGAELDAAIEEYTATIIAQYEESAAAVQEYEEDPLAPPAETNRYQVNVDYAVVTDNDALFALRFNETVVMASGNESVKIYNVDKVSGKILTLAELFQKDSAYLDVLTTSIQQQMRQRMDADDGLYYWLNDEVEAWNFTALDPETAFFVNEDGLLTIVFDEGVVAPMYMGIVEFTIPMEAVSSIARADYLK